MGGVVLIAAIIIAVLFFLRKKRQAEKKTSEKKFEVDYPPSSYSPPTHHKSDSAGSTNFTPVYYKYDRLVSFKFLRSDLNLCSPLDPSTFPPSMDALAMSGSGGTHNDGAAGTITQSFAGSTVGSTTAPSPPPPLSFVMPTSPPPVHREPPPMSHTPAPTFVDEEGRTYQEEPTNTTSHRTQPSYTSQQQFSGVPEL